MNPLDRYVNAMIEKMELDAAADGHAAPCADQITISKMYAVAPQPEIYEPVIITNRAKVKIHPTARIDSFVKIEGGKGVVIGPYVHIASFAHLNIGGGSLYLDEGSSVASGARIVTGSNMVDMYSCSAVAPESWQRVERSRVYVGPGAVIFAGATILPGVMMGEGSAAAAGAVVRHMVPEYEIWGGVPAKKIGTRPKVIRPDVE